MAHFWAANRRMRVGAILALSFVTGPLALSHAQPTDDPRAFLLKQWSSLVPPDTVLEYQWTRYGSVGDEPLQEIESKRILVHDRSFALYEDLLSEDGNTPRAFVNSDYSAVVEGARTRPYLLKELSRRAQEGQSRSPAGFLAGLHGPQSLLTAGSRNFLVLAGSDISGMLARPDTQVVSSKRHDSKLSEITLACRIESKVTPKSLTVKLTLGSPQYLPSRVTIEQSDGMRSEIESQFEDRGGYVVCVQSDAVTKYPDGRTERIRDVVASVVERPASAKQEFYLTYYDLPEPVSLKLRGSYRLPTWLYLVIGGILAIVAGFGILYLAKRPRR